MAYVLIIAAVLLRLVPHEPNFAPIAAMALFGGVYLSKKWAITIPLVAMFISDLFIGFYSWQIMVSVYASFALIGAIGLWVRKNKNATKVIGATLSGSIIFFIVTNFAVWAFSGMYAHSLQGLASCYIAAIPFFKNTLMGDFFYVGALFGSYELALALISSRKIAIQE